MKRNLAYYAVLAALSTGLVAATPALAADQGKASASAAQAAKRKVIFQVSDNDPKKWGLALNNASNVQQDLGKDNVEIEIVAYGPGLAMLKLDSEAGGRVKTALDAGVKVVACENTMRAQKLTESDMLPGLGYAKAGVVELMKRQEEGYTYIRP